MTSYSARASLAAALAAAFILTSPAVAQVEGQKSLHEVQSHNHTAVPQSSENSTATEPVPDGGQHEVGAAGTMTAPTWNALPQGAKRYFTAFTVANKDGAEVHSVGSPSSGETQVPAKPPSHGNAYLNSTPQEAVAAIKSVTSQLELAGAVTAQMNSAKQSSQKTKGPMTIRVVQGSKKYGPQPTNQNPDDVRFTFEIIDIGDLAGKNDSEFKTVQLLPAKLVHFQAPQKRFVGNLMLNWGRNAVGSTGTGYDVELHRGFLPGSYLEITDLTKAPAANAKFAALDKDGDGKLSKAEIGEAITEAIGMSSDSIIEMILKDPSVNADGGDGITISEADDFLAVLANLR